MFNIAPRPAEKFELYSGRKSSPTRSELKEKLLHREKYYSKTPGGFARAVGHGIAAEYGFSKTSRGWEFFGGRRGWAMDLSKLKQGWGAATTKRGMASALGKGAGRFGLRALPAVSWLFMGHSIKSGYNEGGIGGAIGGGLEWGATSVGFSAAFSGVGRTFKGSGAGTMMKLGHTRGMTKAKASWAKGSASAGARARHIPGGAASAKAGWATKAGSAALGYTAGSAGPLTRAALLGSRAFAMQTLAMLPVMAGIGHVTAATGRASRDIDAGHRSLGINTSSSLAAFSTKGAFTSRQMSVQAIQRSHLNARSALGNEAQYMHRRGF